MQAALTSHPWLLALPELQPFREFLVDTSSRCESGEVDRIVIVNKSKARVIMRETAPGAAGATTAVA